jgi:hypothetical protein
MSKRQKRIATMLNEFRVHIGNEWHSFLTFEEAKAFAQKSSWEKAATAEIHAPDGKVTKVTVGNAP